MAERNILPRLVRPAATYDDHASDDRPCHSRAAPLFTDDYHLPAVQVSFIRNL